MSLNEMMSSPLPSRRARRIPNEQWEQHRGTLEKLFLEDDHSYKDIIKVMSKDHEFPIT